MKSDIKIDTIVFNANTSFESNLSTIVNKCIVGHSKIKPLTKENVINVQGVLSKELKSDIFKSIGVVTGKLIMLKNTEQWLYIMEWHFNSNEEADLIENTLNRLENGIIRHTIYPNACIWVKSNKKIYVIKYRPIVGVNYWINDIQNCISNNKDKE
jgi:hypothetical protein